jgi:hypothetical protein
MGKPRLPWKRGPVAFKLACHSDEILERVLSNSREYFSLRLASRLLGISTQPLRDWERLGHVRREGPRKQFAKAELSRFVQWIEQRAEPFPTENYVERFYRDSRYVSPFDKLQHSRFLWPMDRKALTPREIADRIGCHCSLIRKAIAHHSGWNRLGRRKSPGRWEISRRTWQSIFPFSRIARRALQKCQLVRKKFL